jgi:hypothetical protein
MLLEIPMNSVSCVCVCETHRFKSVPPCKRVCIHIKDGQSCTLTSWKRYLYSPLPASLSTNTRSREQASDADLDSEVQCLFRHYWAEGLLQAHGQGSIGALTAAAACGDRLFNAA